MSTTKDASWKPLYWFYGLSFLLLALIPLSAILFNEGSMDFGAAAVRASTETGVPWNSNLVNVIRLCLAEPTVWMLVFGSSVPGLAGFLVMIFTYDASRWRDLGRRLHPGAGIDLSAQIKNYLLIPALLLPTLFLSLWLRQNTGGAPSFNPDLLGWAIIPAILSVALLDQGAVLEELGWRGYAAPALEERGVSMLKAAIVIGIAWGLWHVPRDVTTGVIERLGFASYLLLYIPGFFAGTISVSIIIAYFMQRMNGSLIPAIVIHGISNDAIGISGSVSIVEALTPYYQITGALPKVAVAATLVFFMLRAQQDRNPNGKAT
jgi:hypothetical protein